MDILDRYRYDKKRRYWKIRKRFLREKPTGGNVNFPVEMEQ